MIATAYFTESGRIGAVHYGPDFDTLYRQLDTDQDLVAGEFDGNTYYVLNGEPTERPKQATTLTGLQLTYLPTPSTLRINSTAYPVTDSTVDLEFPLPGTYHLRVEAFPYLDWTAEVTV